MHIPKRLTIKPAAAAVLLGATALAGATGALALDDAGITHPLAVAPPVGVLASGQHSLADMVQAVGPSVVQIRVHKRVDASPASLPFAGGGDLDEQMRRFFGFGLPNAPQQQAPQEQGALGSGFIIDPSGIVLTNNHVVDGASDVTVQLSDGRDLKGHVLGTDPKTDVAVVKIDGKGPFRAVQWGDSDHIRVGDSVFAVGSPFGLGNTVTAGIVSARSRDIGEGPYDDFLQVDAAINSGNSGGPLFDGTGHVVGMNTAIYSPSGGNVGIGFAIPEQMARHVADEIIQHGSVARGHIGVALQPVTPEIADAMGMKNENGALIAQVDLDGPASMSGIQQGDVVTRFNNRPVTDSRDFARMVADARAGSRVPVTVVRKGETRTLDLRIGADVASRSG